MLDSSALVAILLEEPSEGTLTEAILAAPIRWISAATLVEASIVMLGRRGDHGDVSKDMGCRGIHEAVFGDGGGAHLIPSAIGIAHERAVIGQALDEAEHTQPFLKDPLV